MDNRTQPIREDIEAIRGSMTDKMEQIESKIKGTVEDTTDSMRRALDVRYHVSQRPWAAMGTAVLVGYALGSMGGHSPAPQYRASTSFRSYQEPGDHRHRTNGDDVARNTPSAFYQYQPSTADAAPHAPLPVAEPDRHQSYGAPHAGFVDKIMAEFGDEFELLKGAAVTALVGLLRDTVRQSMPAVHQEYERLRAEQGRMPASDGDEMGAMRQRPLSAASESYQTPAYGAAETRSPS